MATNIAAWILPFRLSKSRISQRRWIQHFAAKPGECAAQGENLPRFPANLRLASRVFLEAAGARKISVRRPLNRSSTWTPNQGINQIGSYRQAIPAPSCGSNSPAPVHAINNIKMAYQSAGRLWNIAELIDGCMVTSWRDNGYPIPLDPERTRRLWCDIVGAIRYAWMVRRSGDIITNTDEGGCAEEQSTEPWPIPRKTIGGVYSQQDPRRIRNTSEILRPVKGCKRSKTNASAEPGMYAPHIIPEANEWAMAANSEYLSWWKKKPIETSHTWKSSGRFQKRADALQP